MAQQEQKSSDSNEPQQSSGPPGSGGKPRLPVPRTGIDECWTTAGSQVSCQGTGQDGDWQAGDHWPEPRFEDNGDGTVTDRVTDLVWLQNADRFGEVTWVEALRQAQLLSSGGGLEDGSSAGDWRLPNIRELLSLVDFGSAAPALAPEHPFHNVRNAIYWTSTSLASAPTLAWMVTLGIAPTVFNLKGNGCRMWPVKGKGRVAKTGQQTCWDEKGRKITCSGSGQDGDLQAGVEAPDPRFEKNGDGTVTDHLTGLVWLEDANAFGWSRWGQAVEHCNRLSEEASGLSDGSEPGDWRLPNVREIETLVDYGRFAPSLPLPEKGSPPFQNISPTSYWTSTTVASAPTQAMFTIFGVGPTIFENKEHPLLVWPVRDAA